MFPLLLLLTLSIYAQEINNNKFPDDFMFGVATAAYQIEGAWNTDGKGENIWDRLTHEKPYLIVDQTNADIACDSYNKWKEDVQLLIDMGVSHYRFSLSWSRILPTGFVNEVNEAGVNYYKNLIKELRANNIEPLVTMFHWDLPQPLEEAGGWLNEDVIDWFADYARKNYELFGKDVTYWSTFNEPKQTCNGGYGGVGMAPNKNSTGNGEYICVHNLVRAHAKAWHIYDEEFRKIQQGKVGIVLDCDYYAPASDSEEDIFAADTQNQFICGFYANPLFNGDYPAVMKENIARRSKEQGYPKSRLPEFTVDEIEYVKGTVDLLGLNLYTGSLVARFDEPDPNALGLFGDSETKVWQPDEWPSTPSSWLKIYPAAMRGIINWIKNEYNNPTIIITENGVSDYGLDLEDDIRITYHQEYLSSLLDAMTEDGVKIIGYTAWSLLDNFEWLSGYSEKFGFYSVNFNDPNRTRSPKKSLDWYKNVIRTKCLVDICA